MGAKRLPLFESLAKRTDPASSYMTTSKLHKSGAARTQARRVLECLRRHSPATGAEVGRRMGGDRYAAHRRLSELERAGLVERAGFRRCEVTNRKCQAWRAVESEQTLFGNSRKR